MKARRESLGDHVTPIAKKVKKEEKKKNGEKDGKKSCSECRRLKAKCDRVFPCSNCRRRGCALVCPDGDLSCMQGKRLVLASTEQLHERIAQLEAALFQAHSALSTKSHPLLAPQYLDGGFADPNLSPPREEVVYTPPAHVHTTETHPISPKGAASTTSASSYALVTPELTANSVTQLGLLGEKEHGPTQSRMAVESLLLSHATAAPEGKREDEWAGENAAPAMIVGNVGSGQDIEEISERHTVLELLTDIRRILPSREETARRAAHFWQSSGWFQNILKQEEFDAIYEPAVYAPTQINKITPHKLACVLMVLCLDTYFDISTETVNPAVAEYWQGVQKCFDTRFGWSASLPGVQALALVVFFVGFGWRGVRTSNFFWLRLMTSQALQLGLHRDPHPSLPAEEREFRRRVFHEMYTIDCLVSINHGQRTAITLETIETQFPEKVSMQARVKYDYMRHVKNAVINIGCLPDSAPASWEEICTVQERMSTAS
ncbi:hypothetical protein TREMEDRAFT_33487 [Tremella mesenterica DSM 1558]|nr:uncharacterized protein TREMEDRAFT_33487 [Tremella mesenterica DSM 1558]EIW67603.1 hypothetical protein TREMEDRAFT_33487 [Tremella mesenterica DSM 1558]